MKNERANQRPFDEYPYTRLAEPNGLASVIWDIDVFVSRRGGINHRLLFRLSAITG